MTIEDLMKVFIYNPVFGHVFQIDKRYDAPRRAGTLRSDGYWTIKLPNGKTTGRSRLGWMLYHAKEIKPGYVIDHINGVTFDDRIENLREITPSENQQNRVEHRNGRIPGVSFVKSKGKWKAVRPSVFMGLFFDKPKYFGEFTTEKEAYEVLLKSVEISQLIQKEAL